jgi:hypothetical protein
MRARSDGWVQSRGLGFGVPVKTTLAQDHRPLASPRCSLARGTTSASSITMVHVASFRNCKCLSSLLISLPPPASSSSFNITISSGPSLHLHWQTLGFRVLGGFGLEMASSILCARIGWWIGALCVDWLIRWWCRWEDVQEAAQAVREGAAWRGAEARRRVWSA